MALVACAAAPAAADPRRAAGFVKVSEARVLFFPVDIGVYEIAAGGAVLKQDWTDTARGHVRHALESEIAARRATVVPYQEPEAPAHKLQHLQIFKVYRLVSHAILLHSYSGEAYRLPNKAGRFDWSVGPAAAALREGHGDPDYTLFVSFVEGHASSGRVAMNVLGALLGGIVTGRQTGLASLVDLKTGDVVWFNRNVESDGDLRTATDALKAVKRLLKELPL